MNITSRLEEITPEIAGEWLAKHYERVAAKECVQRPVKRTVAGRYAADMKSGNWIVSPQPIAFDVNGNLVDGQHRLEAICESGCTIVMMVSRGWPVQTNKGVNLIDVIDTGKPRSVGDMLAMHGQRRSKEMAATMRTMCIIALNGQACAMTFAMCRTVMDKFRGHEAFDAILTKTRSARQDMRATSLAPLAWYWTVRPRKALEFAEEFYSMTARKGSAISAYLRYIKVKRTHTELLQGMCAAIRSEDAGETIEVCKPTLQAVQWLSALNPQLAKNIRDISARSIERLRPDREHGRKMRELAAKKTGNHPSLVSVPSA